MPPQNQPPQPQPPQPTSQPPIVPSSGYPAMNDDSLRAAKFTLRTITSLLFIFAGIIFVRSGAPGSYEKTTATVTAASCSYTTFSFENHNGVSYHSQMYTYGKCIHPYRVGQNVSIAYSPEDPAHTIKIRDINTYSSMAAFVIAGIICLALPALAVKVGKMNVKKAPL